MIPLPPHQIDLWRIPLRPLPECRYQAYFQGLLPEERAQHDAYCFSADRLRYLLTRVLSRRVMAAYLNRTPENLVFSQNAFGRPALSMHQNHLDLDFNLAHNEDYILCAIVRQGAVGVDIEHYRQSCRLALVEDFFSPQELVQILRQDGVLRDQQFFQLWTLKEAFIKAVGKGMAIPLDAFYFLLEEGGRSFFDPEKHGGDLAWHFFSWETEGNNIVSIAAATDLCFSPAAEFRLQVYEIAEIPEDFAKYHQDNAPSIANFKQIHTHFNR